MILKALAPFAALFALALAAGPALASDPYGDNDDGYIKVWKPYVIEKNCMEHFRHCKVRMDYAPFQRAMVARPGSYWYQKPFLVYRYGDFKPRPVLWGHRHRPAEHLAWCAARYKTYDPVSDYYKGRGLRLHRCDSPYDGR